MTTSSQPDASTAGWIDEICDRFERAWRGGESPRIETHLQGTEGQARAQLLGELLLLEVDLRLESGEHPGPEEYLQRFPSDASLIEQLLQEVTQSRAPSATTTIGVPDSATPTGPSPAGTEVPPDLESFGDYELLEQVGRGGMGVVYRARQRSANRIVALKLIRHDHLSGLPGAHREEIIDRFHNEALATASLDHDHIVTVYEVGEIEGQHFFSMQYVGGPSLSQVLAKGPMEARRAAKDLIPVARALHAAHQRGVLHRDVNPRNLLIDPRDNRLLVADFGLAKLREADVALTKAGTTFGSPPYMAPEQVRDAANVTEAADVYGLGATLYQMLTGRPPFQAATVADTLCQVLSEQPASTRELNPAIDRDLDTICMKCLEKDPARRYRSADEVADELERFVNSEPILARPVGYLGRFSRWCRRNPVLATVVIVSAVLLTIAATVATIAAFQASAALKGEVEQRLRAEDRHRVAENRLDKALQIMDGNMRFLWENPAMKSRGLETPRRDQLQRAADLYDELVSERPDDPKLLADQARAHFRLADISEETGQSDKAEKEYRMALEIQQSACRIAPANDAHKRDWAESLSALGRLFRKTGRFDEAERADQEALSVCLPLAADDPENRRRLADSHAELGELMVDLARPSEALGVRKAELAIREELANGHPDAAEYRRELAECLASLASLHFELSELQEAETDYDRAVEIAENLPLEESPENHEALAVAYSNLGLFYHLTGRLDDAQAKFGQAQKIMTALAEEHRDVPRYWSNLAAGWHSLAEVYRANNRFEEAESALENAIKTCRALVADYPSLLQCHVDLASGYHNLAAHYLAAAKDEAAETAEKNALDIFRELAEKHPRIPDRRSDFAWVQISLGELYWNTDRVEQAEGAFQAAVAELTRLVEEYPTVPAYRSRLATGLVRHSQACAILGAVAQQEGDFAEAERWCTSALDARLRLQREHPDDPEVSSLVLISAVQRAELLGKQGRHADALADWQLAIDRAPPELSPGLQMEAAVALARSGDHAAAAAKAEEILPATGTEAQSGDLAFAAARVLAQAARAAQLDGDLDQAQAEQQRQTCLAKAMDYLRMAQRAGFFDGEEARETLRIDPDLDPLRQHDDFRKFLEEIGVDPNQSPPAPAKVEPRVARHLRPAATIG